MMKNNRNKSRKQEKGMTKLEDKESTKKKKGMIFK